MRWINCTNTISLLKLVWCWLIAWHGHRRGNLPACLGLGLEKLGPQTVSSSSSACRCSSTRITKYCHRLKQHVSCNIYQPHFLAALHSPKNCVLSCLKLRPCNRLPLAIPGSLLSRSRLGSFCRNSTARRNCERCASSNCSFLAWNRNLPAHDMRPLSSHDMAGMTELGD